MNYDSPPEMPDSPEYYKEEEEDKFPRPELVIVPAGIYACQIVRSPIKRTSQFLGQDWYYELPLKLKDKAGNVFKFNFSFSLKSQIYAQVILLVGGTEQPTGQIDVPPKTSIIGKLFMAEIIKRPMKNNKDKIMNDIIKVWPHEPHETEMGPAPQAESKEGPSKEAESKEGPSKEAGPVEEESSPSPEEGEVIPY